MRYDVKKSSINASSRLYVNTIGGKLESDSSEGFINQIIF